MVEIVCLVAMSVWAIFMHRALSEAHAANRELMKHLPQPYLVIPRGGDVAGPIAQPGREYAAQVASPPSADRDFSLEDLG